MRDWLVEFPRSVSEHLAVRERVKAVRAAGVDVTVEARWAEFKTNIIRCLFDQLRDKSKPYYRQMQEAADQCADGIVSRAETSDNFATLVDSLPAGCGDVALEALLRTALLGKALRMFKEDGIDIPLDAPKN